MTLPDKKEFGSTPEPSLAEQARTFLAEQERARRQAALDTLAALNPDKGPVSLLSREEFIPITYLKSTKEKFPISLLESKNKFRPLEIQPRPLPLRENNGIISLLAQLDEAERARRARLDTALRDLTRPVTPKFPEKILRNKDLDPLK